MGSDCHVSNWSDMQASIAGDDDDERPASVVCTTANIQFTVACGRFVLWYRTTTTAKVYTFLFHLLSWPDFSSVASACWDVSVPLCAQVRVCLHARGVSRQRSAAWRRRLCNPPEALASRRSASSVQILLRWLAAMYAMQATKRRRRPVCWPYPQAPQVVRPSIYALWQTDDIIISIHAHRAWHPWTYATPGVMFLFTCKWIFNYAAPFLALKWLKSAYNSTEVIVTSECTTYNH